MIEPGPDMLVSLYWRCYSPGQSYDIGNHAFGSMRSSRGLACPAET